MRGEPRLHHCCCAEYGIIQDVEIPMSGVRRILGFDRTNSPTFFGRRALLFDICLNQVGIGAKR